jgi:hypothetical protein
MAAHMCHFPQIDSAPIADQPPHHPSCFPIPSIQLTTGVYHTEGYTKNSLSLCLSPKISERDKLLIRSSKP